MILSFFVVMVHASYTNFYSCPPTMEESFNVLYTKSIPGFAVPMFFIISGMKFYNNFTWDIMASKLNRRKKSLLIPYLSWNVISLIWAIIISTIPFISQFIKVRTKFEMSYSNVFEGIFLFKYIHPLWYLAVLVLFFLLTPLFYSIIRNRIIGITVILSLYFLHSLPINYPETHYPLLPIRTILYSTLFFLVGAYLGKYYYQELCRPVKKGVSLVAFILFCFVIIARFYSEEITYCFIPLVLLGSVCIWVMTGCLRIRNYDWLHMSFFIYPAHTFILPCVNKIVYFMFPNSFVFAVLNTIFGTLITYLLCIFLGIYVKNHFKSIWIVINGR